jgi:hypothetical protein
MAITVDWMKDLFKSANVRFLVDPDNPALMFGVTTPTGKNFMVRAAVEANGYFLQLRSVQFGNCTKDNPSLPAVLRVLAALNYKFRVIKYGWDQNDGEIAVYIDLTVADTTPTRDQVMSLIGYFIDMLDKSRDRIMKTVQTGTDPGEEELV